MSSLQLKGKRKLIRKTSDDDRISNLPDNAAQQILECLPLKEAAKTSILSRYWRYKWVSTSKLVLDERSILHGILAASGDYDNERSLAFSKAINKILFSHVGPILKFDLCLLRWFSKEADMISHWIQYVYAKGVKELTLDSKFNDIIDIPPCLLSCVTLTHFTLKCEHLHIPPTLKGFPCLISLNLTFVSVGNTKEALKNLISKCPLLEILCLEIYGDDIEVFICAPKLQRLSLKGDFINDVSLEGTTVIKRLDLDIECLYFQNSKNVGDFFSCFPKVEKLILGYLFCQIVEGHRLISPNKFAKELEQLRLLQLEDIDLDGDHSISFLLCLLQSSPNLEHLYVKAADHGGVFEDDFLIDGSCNLKHLISVQLINIPGMNNEFQLIKFLLASSPALKEMRIELGSRLVRKTEEFKFAKELLRYSRASPYAEIIFKE